MDARTHGQGTGLLGAAAAPCIVCGECAWDVHYRILRRCGSCGFIRAQDDLDDANIRKLYEEDYFHGKEYGDYLADRKVHRTNFSFRLEQVLALTGGLESLYEIGSAYGLWLEQVRRRGIRCAGIDICEAAANYAARALGLDVACGDFLDQPLEAGVYQAFCMFDTIEHLAHPEDYVQRIHQLLPEGGWLFVTTGDIGSAVARRRGRRWRMIHPPTHLHYFSQQTMSRFLERLGFEVMKIQTVPMYRNVRSVLTAMLALSKGLPRKAAWLAERTIPRFVQEALGFWLNLGDIMFVAARKPGSNYRGN